MADGTRRDDTATKVFRQIVSRWSIFPLILSIITFWRLQVNTANLSYDYSLYIRFFEYVEKETIDGAISNIIQNVPYYAATIHYGYVFILRFEIGFAVVVMFVTKIIGPTSTFAFLTSASIYGKFFALKRMCNVPWYLAIGVFVFVISLLETNALRAGMAQTILFVGLYVSVKKDRLLDLVVASIAATSLHLSAAFPSLILLGCWCLLRGPRLSRIKYITAVASACAIGPLFSVTWLSNLFPKVEEYILLDEGIGGVNIGLMSIMSVVLLAIDLFCIQKLFALQIRGESPIMLAACGALVLFTAATSLYVFATDVTVVAPRIWQFSFPFGLLPCGIALRIGALKRHEKLMVQVVLLFVSIGIMLQFLSRYVLTNFFSPLIGYTPLNSGQCSTGLCF